jgi:hypothetical protein
MSTGNKAIPDLPAIPDPTGGSLYITKDNVDYRVDTGGIGGLATLGSDGLLDSSQRFTISSFPWTSITSKPTTLAGYAITDAVNTFGAQSITGVKTFINTIQGNIAGNATSATTATSVAWTGITGKPTTLAGYGITNGQVALGYTPVQQGTGVGQGANAVKLGWASGINRLKATVDATDLGNIVFDSQLAGKLDVNGSGGIGFGSVIASTNTDLSKHISLHASANYGFNVTSGALNYVTNSSGTHHFNTGGTDRAVISSTGLAVTGAISATGNVTGYSSDKRLKTNVKNIEDPMGKLYQIGGYTFDWNEPLCFLEGFRPDNVHEHGVLAQEVQKVIPDAVSPAPFNENYLTVNYPRLIPLLIECIKDLQAQIDELKEYKYMYEGLDK